MFQYIKTAANGTLAEPIEVTLLESAAIQLWGEGNYVHKDIPDDLHTCCKSPNLDADGHVQMSATKKAAMDLATKPARDNKKRAGWWEIAAAGLASNIRAGVPQAEWPAVYLLMANNIKPTDDDWLAHNPAYVIEE